MPSIRHRTMTVDGLNIFVRDAGSRSRGGRWTASTRRTTASSATLPTLPSHRYPPTSRHLLVRAGDRGAADTMSPIVPSEFAFAPRWYVPRADVAAAGLVPTELQTSCSYEGIASYYDIDAGKMPPGPTAHRSTTWRRLATWSRSSQTASRSPSRPAPRSRAGAERRLARHRPQPRHRRRRRNDGRRRKALPDDQLAIHQAPRNIDHADAGCETAWRRSSATSNLNSADTEPANGPTESRSI
jgi:uncharacterized protein (DUF427 family)